MIHRYRKRGLFIIIFVSLVTVALYVVSKPVNFEWNTQLLRLLSQILALLGTVYLSFTFILSSRIKGIESIFGGQDIIYKIHHFLGAVAFVFLLHHPLLLAVRQFPNFVLAQRYIFPSSNLAYTTGIVALFIMLILLILTFFISLPYHIWKQTHTWMGSVLLFSMAHVFLIKSDISNFLPLRIWVLSWMFIAFISFILKTFAYKWYADIYKYSVKEIIDSELNITLQLIPTSKKTLTFIPGQFVFISVKDNVSIGKESHPFSLASAPSNKTITLICKKTGDYVDKLLLLRKGDIVTLSGPYGTFMEKVPVSQKIVGIAGGIGITPFLSLIDEANLLPKNYPPILIFHLVKKKQESQLTEKISTQRCGFQIIEHNSVSKKRFSVSDILLQVDSYKKANFFLCGPMGMMIATRDQLLKAGISPSRIIFEDFSFG